MLSFQITLTVLLMSYFQITPCKAIKRFRSIWILISWKNIWWGSFVSFIFVQTKSVFHDGRTNCGKPWKTYISSYRLYSTHFHRLYAKLHKEIKNHYWKDLRKKLFKTRRHSGERQFFLIASHSYSGTTCKIAPGIRKSLSNKNLVKNILGNLGQLDKSHKPHMCLYRISFISGTICKSTRGIGSD